MRTVLVLLAVFICSLPPFTCLAIDREAELTRNIKAPQTNNINSESLQVPTLLIDSQPQNITMDTQVVAPSTYIPQNINSLSFTEEIAKVQIEKSSATSDQGTPSPSKESQNSEQSVTVDQIPLDNSTSEITALLTTENKETPPEETVEQPGIETSGELREVVTE